MKLPPVAAVLASAIANATRSPFEPIEANAVGGGCIHTALRIEGEGSAGRIGYFAKVNAPATAAMFEAEADGLAALREAGALRVPAVIARGADDEHAWLVLEWLELAALDGPAAARLGDALARQHAMSREKFGWARDNFIGATPQANGWSDDWLAFWRDRRLHAQLRIAARKRLPTRMIDRGERLLADCEAFYSGYTPARSLLHGDLWSGNVAALAGGEPVVFDPAVYVGDREADVAMTELFGGFPPEFMAAYRRAWDLDAGYAVRRGFYNLYHVLNHANLFAGGYVRQAGELVERLIAELR